MAFIEANEATFLKGESSTFKLLEAYQELQLF